MIKYVVCCAKGHKFEEWFESIAVYEKMEKDGLISCPICGDTKISRAIMAPKVYSNVRTNAKKTCDAEKKFGSTCCPSGFCDSGSCP